MPHKARRKRPGHADGMAAGLGRAESHAVQQRTGLHRDVAPERTDINGGLPAELYADPRRLRAATADEFGRTVSCDDNGRTGDHHRRRNGVVHRASNTDKPERGGGGHTGVGSGGHSIGRRDMHGHTARLAIIRSVIYRDRRSCGDMHPDRRRRCVRRSGSKFGHGNRQRNNHSCTSANANRFSRRVRPNRKREMLSSNRRPDQSDLLEVRLSRYFVLS